GGSLFLDSVASPSVSSSRRGLVALAIVIWCLALHARALADSTISVVDGRGKRITLAHAPTRIVSIAPSNTEILFALGLNGRIAAEAIVRGMKVRIEAVRKRVSREPNWPKVIIVVQSQPLIVAGSQNFQDEIVTVAGGENVGRDAGSGFPPYAPERAIADQPD